MKIFSAEVTQQLDAYTIENEPIPSIDLMERASQTFVHWFTGRFPDEDQPILIFCGPGNNGGDGLAVARLLYHRFYEPRIYRCRIGRSVSEDFQTNLDRLPPRQGVPVYEVEKEDEFPPIPLNAIVIDAIFGSGLNRPVTGYWAQLLNYLNQHPNPKVAIDIPSGLFADRHTEGMTFRAGYTFSFELPKLAFFFPENQRSVGEWIVESIGLHPDFIARTQTPFHYFDEPMAAGLLRPRHKYDHKGHFGHALLIMGSYGKVGAAILAARACLRSGVGLVSVHAPKCAYEILQISIPEAMVSVDRHQFYLSEIPDLKPYRAIGAGCGLDQKKTSREALAELLTKAEGPLVLDADGLNIIAGAPELLSKIPKGSILTPHPKEFERLFGKTEDDFARNELQRRKAWELGVVLLLKGAHSCIADPDGNCYFNATGNPGMATGGSGDVLTGVITGLLAQGYTPLQAAQLGVFLHGLAGDLAAEKLQHESLIASDIVDQLGNAFKKLRNGKRQ
jgi:NAD(P)H-hydrate epimerase